MGSITFVRASDQSRLSFDSSPGYTLPKAFGFAEGSIRLEEISRNADTISFAVFARSSADSPVESRVGSLFQKTKESIWRSLK